MKVGSFIQDDMPLESIYGRGHLVRNSFGVCRRGSREPESHGPSTPGKKLKVMHSFLRFGKPTKTIHDLFWFEYKQTATGIHANSKLIYIYFVVLRYPEFRIIWIS